MGPRTSGVVFAGAPLAPTPRLRARLAALEAPYVVAADGGAATALAFGQVPDLVVGDLDSLDAPTLAELARRRVPVERHPRDKEATDGQLAVERALAARASPLLLLGFLGGPRLDQAVANLLLLATLPRGALLLDELNECALLRSGEERSWAAEPGELVSLLPLGSDARGVRTRGLRWGLAGDTLGFGQTRGVSNEPVAARVRVSLEAGLLLVTRHFPAPAAGRRLL